MSDTASTEQWQAVENPVSKQTEQEFDQFLSRAHPNLNVLNCAIPLHRARTHTDFQLPAGVASSDCIKASVIGTFPAALRGWKYQPRIRPEPQLPQMKTLPWDSKSLGNLPWFDSPAQSTHLAINARHLRYHHALWQQLRPKVLQGVHTTLVLALPQMGFALSPHIQLDKSFLFLGALGRGLGPVQLFPARYLYPEANLGSLANAPAPIFADVLPTTGGFAYPVVDCEPDPWRVLARFGKHNRYTGYPFTRCPNALDDFSDTNLERGATLLPDGSRVTARHSETHAYATLDLALNRELLLDRADFGAARGLLRGTVTHDGLPFQLPVELQCLVYAVILTRWRMELDHPGDLSSYAVFTDHAAIRGHHYFQRVAPFHAQFMRLVQEISKDPAFCTYPLSTHLTHSWLGGNLQLSNQLSDSEQELGPNLMHAYYHQQLDWQAGVSNLMNHVAFRKSPGARARSGLAIERELSRDGLAFHQMQRLLRFDSHLFRNPQQRASYWPNYHPGFLELDRKFLTESLPRL